MLLPDESRREECRPTPIARALAFATLAALVASAAPRVAGAEDAPSLDVEGMTFVASRDDVNELVLEAVRARFLIDRDLVHLEEVRAVVDSAEQSGSFEMECDEGELDLATNDFHARGNVRGRTKGGRQFAAPWVRYDHEAGLLFTDASVLITEDATTYRGGGFRYYVRERRFRLLGGASVVQQP